MPSSNEPMTPERLLRARKQFGYTQEEMARELKLGSVKTYQNYEQGQRPIPGHLQNTVQMMRKLKRLEDA